MVVVKWGLEAILPTVTSVMPFTDVVKEVKVNKTAAMGLTWLHSMIQIKYLVLYQPRNLKDKIRVKVSPS